MTNSVETTTSVAETAELPWPLLLPPEPVLDLDDYEARGGGVALDHAREFGPDHVLSRIEAAGLRGRGGAGFPAATKWRSIRDSPHLDGDRFVVANGAEGEPGSFKDRALLRRNPFQVLEGVLVAALVVEATEAFVAVKASFDTERQALERALRQLEAAGWLDVPLRIVAGPEEYLFGEEKALLEVIEGEEPLPRLLPPYQYGLFATSPNLGWSANQGRSPDDPTRAAANPTLVNNVETFACVTAALRVGPEAFRSQGTSTFPGTRLVTVSGDTRRDGVAEVPAGTTLRQVIEAVGGGMPPGREVKAVLSGVANAVLTADDLDVPLTHEDLAALGSGLGAAGFIVFDDRRSMASVARAVSWFLHVESCGQCSPCKSGTGALALAFTPEQPGDITDLSSVERSLKTVDSNARCYLPTQSRIVIASLLRRFPEDFAGPLPPEPDPVRVAKILDIVDDHAVLDDAQARKRPDWTYASTPVSIRSEVHP